MTHETDKSSSIAYELFKTGDTQEWNNNNNLFSGLGSGSVEAIPVIAKVSRFDRSCR
jgi:spore coat protein U-like protein